MPPGIKACPLGIRKMLLEPYVNTGLQLFTSQMLLRLWHLINDPSRRAQLADAHELGDLMVRPEAPRLEVLGSPCQCDRGHTPNIPSSLHFPLHGPS